MLRCFALTSSFDIFPMSTLKQNLDLRQTQNLVMTPQLQQAIQMLQLSNLELAEHLDKEIAQNPLLEKDDSERDKSSAAEDNTPTKAEQKDSMQSEFDTVWTGDDAGSSGGDHSANLSMGGVGSGGSHNFDDSEMAFDAKLSDSRSLRDTLLEQLHLHMEDPRDRMIGARLIDMLDDQGYLRYSKIDLREELGCSVDRLDRLLGHLKTYDPPGIFAQNLPECLALQLTDQGKMNDQMQILLDNMDMMAEFDHKGLAKKCGVELDEIAMMIDMLKGLNPRPASLFEDFVTQPLIPDVFMRRLPKNLGGGWRVELNSETLPRVLVNNQYYKEISNKSKNKDDKEYLNNQLAAANWLVRAMDQRAQTILKVASDIVENQDSFFLYGIEFLQPMTLRDVAERVELHESTISRVTNNKYIGTPRGIFELKYFFSTAIGGANGQVYSAESIRAQVKNLIDGEDPENILSDDKIVEILKKDGIDIARRTVAKYREALHIPSSSRRRKQKKNMLSE